MAEYSNDVVVRVGLDGRVIYISPAVRKFGYEPEAIVGASGVDLVHPDDRASFSANVAALLRGEADPNANRQHRIRTSDGRWVWMEGNPQTVLDAAGDPIEILNVFRDVTHRRAAEDRGREQAELFEAAFRYAAVGMALVALDGSFIRLNDAFCRIVGYPPKVMQRLDFQTITHPDDLHGDLDLLARLNAGEIASYELDKRYLRHDGSPVWVHLTVSMIRDAEGAPKHYVAQVQDLTERKTAEDKLRQSEERYRLITEHSSDMIIVADLSHAITYVSPSITRLGAKPSDFIGLSYTDLFGRAERAEIAAARHRLKAGESAVEAVRIRLRHAQTGTLIWAEARKSVMRDPVSGDHSGYIDVVRDITLQVAQEQALAESRAEAEAAASVKTQFLANMSHEIRTPLTAVLGYTSLLAKMEGLGETAESFVASIAGAGNGLLALVNDILDFSKLEAGKFDIHPKPTNLEQVCRETLSIFDAQASDKGLELDFTMEDGLAPTVLVDGERVRQMLINLVGNGVKFTEAGSVELALKRGSLENEVVVQVSDTGPGLDADAEQRLFQRFSQIDGSNTRKHSGTGLGLAITRGLAEAIGGTVLLASVPGQGSTFTLTFPAEPCDMTSSQTNAEVGSIAGARVLVVDDNAANRELASRLLAAMGADVTTARSGPEALAELSVGAVDVVLLDLRMPGMSGDQVLTTLRALHGASRLPPVLAFTADADVAAGTDLARFSGLVRKPIEPFEMLRAIAAALTFSDKAEDETRAAA